MTTAMRAQKLPPNPMVEEHLRASKRVMKKVLSSQKTARAFLIDAGILTKSGKGLAKPYR